VSAPISAATAAGASTAPAAVAWAIDVRGVRFGYRAGQTVLDIPALQVARGEKVFLYGPSGSGKTTLLGLLAGVLRASTGEVRVLGTELDRLSPSQRDRFRAEHIGYIFQMFNLIPYLSVRENITLPCRLSRARRARLGGTSPDAAAAELARRLEIAAWEHTPVTELSVGQQQRVAAARALLGSPELVIADEPTSALDAERRERFLELLFEQCAQAGSTLLFVSHDRQLAPLFDRELSLPELQGSGAGVRGMK